MAQEWLLTPDDFNRLDNALDDQSTFEVDLVKGEVRLTGLKPDFGDDVEALIFTPLRQNSLAFIWLSAAWNHNLLQYVVFVNEIPFGFLTAFGWSFIPITHYAVGRLPAKFRDAYGLAYGVFLQVKNRAI